MRKILAALFLAALLTLGCLNQALPQSNEQPSDYALGFSVKDVNGKTITPQDVKGKPLILQSFASWCSSCAAKAAIIRQVYADTGVQVLYFDVMPDGESKEQVKAFQDAYGDSQWFWIAEKNDFPQLLGVQTLDYTAVLDGNGHVVYESQDQSNVQSIENTLKTIER